MGALPCGSYNYLILLNLPMDYCTCQMYLFDHLPSRVRPWLRRRDSSPCAQKGPFSQLIRLFLAHSSLAYVYALCFALIVAGLSQATINTRIDDAEGERQPSLGDGGGSRRQITLEAKGRTFNPSR